MTTHPSRIALFLSYLISFLSWIKYPSTKGTNLKKKPSFPLFLSLLLVEVIPPDANKTPRFRLWLDRGDANETDSVFAVCLITETN